MLLEFLCTQSPLSHSSPCLSSCLCTHPQQVLPLELRFLSCASGSYSQVNCTWEPGRLRDRKASLLCGTWAKLELRCRCGAHLPPLSRSPTESTNPDSLVRPSEPRQRLNPAAAPVRPCHQPTSHPYQVRNQLFSLRHGKYVVCVSETLIFLKMSQMRVLGSLN